MANETSHDLVTELPVLVSPERAEQAGAYFQGILDSYGLPSKIPVMGRLSVHQWDGTEARFEVGDEALTVREIPATKQDGGYIFPEISATISRREKNPSNDSMAWKTKDQFQYHRTTGKLTYRNGALFYRVGDGQVPPPGSEGVQSAPRWRLITVHNTPPPPEGVGAILEFFTDESQRLIEDSQKAGHRIRNQLRKIGSRVRRFALLD